MRSSQPPDQDFDASNEQVRLCYPFARLLSRELQPGFMEKRGAMGLARGIPRSASSPKSSIGLPAPLTRRRSRIRTELNYTQLIDEVRRAAAALSELGVREGDRVALLIPNSVDFVTTRSRGALGSRALFVPLAVTDPQTRVAHIVSDCAPSLIVAAEEFEEMAVSIGAPITVLVASLHDRNPPARPPVDAHLAYIIYTSGTTGTPKGVEISNEAFAHAVHHVIEPLNMDRETQTLCISPFHFDGFYGSLFPTLCTGGRVVIRPPGGSVVSACVFLDARK